MIRLLFLLLFLLCGSQAYAQCTGPGGVPFNCTVGNTPTQNDLVLGGSLTAPQSGKTIRWTWGQVYQAFSSFLAPTAGTVTASVCQDNGGVLVKANGENCFPVTWPATGSLIVSSGTNTPTGLAPTDGDCVVGSGGAWTATPCINWPPIGDIIISNGTSTPDSVAPVEGSCLLGSGGVWVAGSCGGLATITVTDSAGTSLSNVSTLNLGPGFVVTGGGGVGTQNLNQPIRLVTTCSGTPNPCVITMNDMGGEVDFNCAACTLYVPAPATSSFTGSISAGTLTISSSITGSIDVGHALTGTGVPVGTIITGGSGTTWTTNQGSLTLSSRSLATTFGASGVGFTVTNLNATSLPIGTGLAYATLTVYPAGASMPQYGGMACLSNGSVFRCPGLANQPSQAYTNLDNSWLSGGATQRWGKSVAPVNTLAAGTTSYTLSATDCGYKIITTTASPFTLNTFSGAEVGCPVTVEQKGTGQVTVFPGAGATQTSSHGYSKTYGQYAVIVLEVDSNSLGTNANWNISGDGS